MPDRSLAPDQRPTNADEAGWLRAKARQRFPTTFAAIRKAPNGLWYVRLGSYSDPRFKEGLTIKTLNDLDAVRQLTPEELAAFGARRA